MKTLAKLVMVLAVLALCLPAYGDVLVYKTSITASGFAINEGEKGKVQARGYFVVDIDLAGAENMNNADTLSLDAELVLYWKAGGNKWRKTVVVDTFDITLVEVDNGRKVYIVAELEVDVTEGTVVAILAGPEKNTDVGLPSKYYVPTGLKGSALVSGNSYMGSGKVSLRLDSKTKYANDNLNGNFDYAVDWLEDYLDDKDYEPI